MSSSAERIAFLRINVHLTITAAAKALQMSRPGVVYLRKKIAAQTGVAYVTGPKPWSPAEDAALINGKRAGFTNAQIALQIGRSKAACVARWGDIQPKTYDVATDDEASEPEPGIVVTEVAAELLPAGVVSARVHRLGMKGQGGVTRKPMALPGVLAQRWPHVGTDALAEELA